MAGVGIIGTGDIAPRYLAGIAACAALRIAGIASRSPDRAAALAAQFGTRATDRDSLLADPAVDIIVNLTEPADHAAVTQAALQAGKHVFSEKPLAATVAQGAALVALAEGAGHLLAVAPATTLGPRQQQARRLIASGQLGAIIGASATMVYPGPDLWHHNPAPLFGAAAGPLFDMGVYDVATLVDLLGPVAQVSGFGRRISATRTIRQGPAAGSDFAVAAPTHVVAGLRFADGPLATLTSSFDGFGSAAAGVEVIGTTAALRIGHSSRFEGKFSLSTKLGQWEPLAGEADGWNDDLWIIGLLDLVAAMTDGRQPHCTARRALHHLAVLEAIATAITTGAVVAVGHAPPPALSSPPGHFGALRHRFGLGQDRAS